MTLNQNFIDWACSFSGCDGGNINADIWFCGIEWGGASKEDGIDHYYKVTLPDEISRGTYTEDSKYDWKETLSFPYGRNLAKLYTVIKGYDCRDYEHHVKGLTDSEIFKMNLYPIAFRNTDPVLWKKYGLDVLTGFTEKHLFKVWCFLNRFPAIASKLSTLKTPPKLIVCTGVSYLTDFFACFAGSMGVKGVVQHGELKAQSGSNQHTSRSYYWATLKNGTVLVVIPFFSGSSGLNSNYLLQEMGKRIRSLR